MAKKYHVTDEGEINECTADVRECKYGSNKGFAGHFSTKKEAGIASEKWLESKYEVSKTVTHNNVVPGEVVSILNNASKKPYSKKMTEKEAIDNIFNGNFAKLTLMKDINNRVIENKTKVAIAKMVLRSDIEVSYNDPDLKHDFISSYVDVMDDDETPKNVQEYAEREVANLWK